MKAFNKLTWMILTCLLMMIFVGSNTVYASSGTISLSDPTASAGDNISVTVKVTATGSTIIKSVNMELTYDAEALEFQSGTSATGEAGKIQLSGSADSSIKTYELEFKALKASTSNIKIASYDIKDSNDTTIEISKVGSSTVTVSGDVTENNDTQTEESTDLTTADSETQEAQTEESEENKIVSPPKKDVEVEIAGTPFNVCQIPENIIPEGFEYIGYMYDGVAVDALKKDNIILFYLNHVGEDPYVFYVYDEGTGGFSVYAPVNSSLDYYVVNLDEGVEIPDGFTATEVSMGGVAVSSWQSDTNSEYYLLYLMTSEGNKNLYLYDIVEKTVQRYYYTSTENSQEETDSYQTMYVELNDKYNKDMQSKMLVIYSLIVVAVIMLFITINLAFKLSDKHHSIVESEDGENEEDEILSNEILSNDYEEEKTFEKIEEQDKIEDNFEDNSEADFEDNFEDDYEDDYEEDFKDSKTDKQLKREIKKAAKLEKKEMIRKEKEAKKIKQSSKEDIEDKDDDFELHIIDLEEDEK